MYLIFGGIITLYDTRAVLNYSHIATAICMAMTLGIGVGSLNCFLGSIFPLYERLWSIATRPLLLVSCVFYTFDSLPSNVRAILIYNPLVHVIGEMRRGFYPDYAGTYISITYVMLIGGIAGAFGLFFLRRYYRVILYEL